VTATVARVAAAATAGPDNFADLTRNVFVVIIMVVVGFAVAFRVHTSFGLLLAGNVAGASPSATH
jgi:membrane-anchored glycerophosphoryl diester phosphodiesterase (GDPDase)